MAKINLNSHTWLVELVEYVEGVRYVREYWKCTTWNGAEITMKDFLQETANPESDRYGLSVEVKPIELKKYVFTR